MKAYFIDAKNELIVETDVVDYHHKKELLNCNYLELYPYQVNGKPNEGNNEYGAK